MTPDNLFNMTNEELAKWFCEEVIKTEQNKEYQQRIEEYYKNIERDFHAEWSKKKFQWFFTKHRQKKLKYKIYLRYASPVFLLVEDVVEEMLPQVCRTNYFFDKFVDIKNIALDEEDNNG